MEERYAGNTTAENNNMYNVIDKIERSNRPN